MYGFARTADLKRNLEQESGQDLTVFFNQWYQGQGYPSYQVQWSELGSSYVKIKMNQATSHASVSFFEMPVALKFKNANQEKTIIVDNKSNGEIFISNIGFIPDTVLVDPEYWLISKNNSTEKIVFPNTGIPVVEFTRIRFKIHSLFTYMILIRHQLTCVMYNMLGQLVYKQQC